MRVLICGGRDFNRHSFIYHTLDDISEEMGQFSHVIVGGASGADYWGESWAWMEKIPFTVFKADWKKQGRAAGPARNQRMIEEGKPDLVVAFPGGSGTADMVRRAELAGIKVVRVSA